MTTEIDPARARLSWGEPSSKTVTWHDPMRVLEATRSQSGLEYFTALLAGTVPEPPIAQLFRFRPVSVGAGDIVFACNPDESMYNPIGMVHGGVACTLLDSAAGCAVHTTLPVGTGYTSVEIKVSYLRPIHAAVGEMFAHGWVAKPGKRVAFAEADLRDGDGVVLATASSTCLVIAG